MSGFDCQFSSDPPQYLQCVCPICLLVLREPFQVTCCGKSFCRECIQQVSSCPTCNQASFESYPNKGLQQPLYGFKVFCSNKERGCGWQGELGLLDGHLNLNPGEDQLFVGCAYVAVQCLFCNEPCLRCELDNHQSSLCAKRPLTCSLCKEYKSSYDDVITNHSPVCKCRPVECPNSCGTSNLQHQHLEGHLSTQCPLTYIDCAFSDAGCKAKVYRKDLPSHMTDNMAAHMLLLASENGKLKRQLKEQDEKLKEQERRFKVELGEHKQMFQKQISECTSTTRLSFCRFTPLNLKFTGIRFDASMEDRVRFSAPFYTLGGGYKLRLELRFDGDYYKFKYSVLGSEFASQQAKFIDIKTILISTLGHSCDPMYYTVRIREHTGYICFPGNMVETLSVHVRRGNEFSFQVTKVNHY